MTDALAPDGYTLVPANRSITIHDRLRHRSGFVGAPASGTSAGTLQRAMSRALPDNPTLTQYVSGLATTPLDVQPGTAWEYGASFVVLGRVIEVVSG